MNVCMVPPKGWYCTRDAGHEGPCAAVPMTPELLYKQALSAAQAATNKMIADNPEQWYPCGFAWVKIRPARGKFVDYLKSMDIGHKGYDGGWDVWNPSNNFTQWLDAKLAGAEAFRDVLRKHGINASADSRWD